MTDERTLTEEDIRTVWAHENGSAPSAHRDDDDDDTTDVSDDSDSSDASDTGDDA